MSYTYYQEIQCDEHMLFAKEIADKYGITSQKVSSILEKYSNDKGILVPRIFYKTKYGLARVYSNLLWIPAMDHAGLIHHS